MVGTTLSHYKVLEKIGRVAWGRSSWLKGYGTNNFSWTAALFLDVVSEEQESG